MSYISVQNVFFKYPHSNKNVLEDVSFVIEKGTYTAIVGLNGSGKSTLARLISGLETPDSGKIIVQDKVKIGLVFQSPKEQIISSVVHRDTAFGPQSYGLNKNEVELRTIECLNIVDMLEYAETSSSALSLGQTQKIA
ncbi:MAG: ATP-binding cassette domain-containing protein, partial [Treponema sp.]|nr:ATP-binding cassette domain-containing protein [Treponema sp.]